MRIFPTDPKGFVSWLALTLIVGVALYLLSGCECAGGLQPTAADLAPVDLVGTLAACDWWTPCGTKRPDLGECCAYACRFSPHNGWEWEAEYNGCSMLDGGAHFTPDGAQ